MASLIPGYEYDIFISYRQKDNHGDHWVTRFVDALNTELESAFKEEISLYFDVNPHDGLRDTHDVDASLKEKLKCLIFIPILSRTYCDPKSFAWEHEFKAFIDMASADRFGLKVKLPGGNVASRVLPVIIHDLDPEDRKMAGEALGGYLRGIEFIYREAGVNKPLTPADDEKSNLNHTKYAIQVNKVANAIREVTSAMPAKPANDSAPDRVTRDHTPGLPAEKFWRKSGKIKWWVAAALLVVLVSASILLVPKLFRETDRKSTGKGHDKSVAVLPFRNDSPDSTNAYFINGVMVMVLDNLEKIRDLTVISRQSVEQFRYDRTSTLPEIARKLGVNYIVEGSGQKYGDQIMLTIQLIDAKMDKQLFSEPYTRRWEDIFSLQKEIAMTVATRINAVITPEESMKMEEKPTQNIQALNAKLRGDECHRLATLGGKWELDQQAKQYYLAALRLDSTFAEVYVQLSWICSIDSSILLIDKALKLNDRLSSALAAKGNRLYLKRQFEEAEKVLEKARTINPGYSTVYRFMADIYLAQEKFTLAVENKLKAWKIEKNTDPVRMNNNIKDMCGILDQLGLYQEGRIFAQEMIDFKNDSFYYYRFKLAEIGELTGIEEKRNSFKKFYQGTHLTIENIPIIFYMSLYFRDIDVSLELMNKLPEMGVTVPHWAVTGFVYLAKGFKKEAKEHFEDYIKNQQQVLERKESPSLVCQTYLKLANTYAGMGNREKALEFLQLYDQNKTNASLVTNYINLKYSPLFDIIRGEAKFRELLAAAETAHQQGREEIREVLRREGIIP